MKRIKGIDKYRFKNLVFKHATIFNGCKTLSSLTPSAQASAAQSAILATPNVERQILLTDLLGCLIRDDTASAISRMRDGEASRRI
jgi:hypothetical protein